MSLEKAAVEFGDSDRFVLEDGCIFVVDRVGGCYNLGLAFGVEKSGSFVAYVK